MNLKSLFSLAALILSGFAAKPIHAAEILPLAGDWRFALDRSDVGTNEQWFAKNLPDKIKLPGILQAQGYGDDIATNTPWVLTLGDAWWKIQPREPARTFFPAGPRGSAVSFPAAEALSRRGVVSARH